MIRRTYLQNGLLSGLIFLGLSCRRNEPAGPDLKCDHALPDSISFSQNVQPILAQCRLPACHTGSHPEGGLNLDSTMAYSQLTKPGSGYVRVVNPKSSVLYSTLNSTSNPMPPTGNLDACSLETVRKWMEQGAKEN